MSNTLHIISIEGNIGSGKSTVVNALKESYKESNEIYFLEEPVSEWENIKDSSNINIIEKFYANQEKYSFAFQMMAYISRLAMLKRAIKECKEKNYKIIVCERSLQTDKYVFCKMLYDSNKIESVEYQIYFKWFDEFINDFPNITFIYIKTTPDIAHQRVLERNRKGETIHLDYLKMCSDYHDTWLNKPDNNIIDGNDTKNNIYNTISNIILTKLK